MKNFALIAAGGYIAPRHMKAIKDTGNNLLAALDKHDSVGILDNYFPEADFFTEFERFDRHLEKNKRQGILTDYVSVCSPNYLHDAHIRFGLRIGAHVICEKPIVLNPWNIDALREIEIETGKNIYTILQLRLHPSIIALKKKIEDGPADKVYEIDLQYITSRGHWYHTSWKGDVNKSGGIATNIGVHFFDMLIWIFGDIKANEVAEHSTNVASGSLTLERANVNWYLSIDSASLPEAVAKSGKRTFRSLTIDDEQVEFSDGFTELHTRSYEEILNGNGFTLSDTQKSIQLVHDIRNKIKIKMELDLNKKKILVTGGAGFVGSNLVQVLKRDYDVEVTVLDDLFSGNASYLDNIDCELVTGSVEDRDLVDSLINGKDIVFHLARNIIVSNKNPREDLNVNVVGSFNVLESCLKNNIERLVYTSTSSIYGNTAQLPIHETDTKSFLSFYSASKYSAEVYAKAFNEVFELPVSVVRYSNVFGYNQSPLNPYCGVIGKFINSALANENIKIHGDGEQTRDFTFIDDAVNATIGAAVSSKAIGNEYNVGTGVEVSINKLAESIISICGSKSVIEHIDKRDIDNIRRRVVSIERARHDLRFSPMTTLNQGLIRTIEWYKLNFSKKSITFFLKLIYSIAGKVLKTDLFKVSAWTSLSTFMRMLSGFVSIKVAANLIGPSGIALVGHFVNVINIVTTLGTGGIGVGVTKYVAEYYDEPLKQQSVLAHAFQITLLCSLLMSFGLILFSVPLGYYIFQTYDYTELIVFFGLTVSLYALNALFLSILNGFKSYKKFVILNIILSAVTLAISVSLVFFLGLYGALLNCILSQSLVVVITFLYLKKETWFRHLYTKINWDKEVIKKLAGFAGIVFTSAILAPLSQLLVRKYISESLSTDTAGIWESMNRLSSMYLVFITSTLSVFYLPKLAEIKDAIGLRMEILKTLKILTPVMLLLCLTIYLLRGYVISIVFSKEFMSMYNLFAIQLTGDFIKITIWIISYQLIAKAMIKKFIVTEIIFHVLFVLFSILGCSYGGIYYCILFGYTLTYLIYSLMIIYLFRKTLFLPQNS